ncbi:MAG TPA: TonB-dependent receptor [Terriglobales bacterium]|nr:TonB-dependent receptor [Terriglobales bacterium]
MSLGERSIRLFVFLLLSPLGADAQQNCSTKPETLTKIAPDQQTFMVTGTYQPIPLDDSERSLRAIDFAESAELYGSWADGVRLDPSVDLRQRAPGTQADLSIRGSSFGQTLVLVDGLRVNDAQSGHHNLDLPLPFASLDRIEILHGSGSTMYGSDAVGGAVNFITAAPRREVVLGTAAGNFGVNEQHGSVAYWQGRVSGQIGFTRAFSSGFTKDRDYRNLAVASGARFATRLGTTSLSIGMSDRPFGADQFYGNFNSWERTKSWFLGSSQELGAHTQAAFGYRRHTDQFVLLRDRPAFYRNDHITESYQLAFRRVDRLAKGLTAFYGVEAYRDAMDRSNLGYHIRNRGAFYASQNFASRKRFSFSTGLRVEIYADGNAQFSPQISLGYRISDRIKLKSSVSHAFRLPTFTDLYYQDPGNIGNPNLKPERAWSYELGLVQKWNDRLVLEATIFTRRERDGIDYVRASPDSVWRAANMDRLQLTGVEINAAITQGHQKVDLGYTGIYGRVEPTGMLISKYIRNYPVHQATAGWLGCLGGRVRLRARMGITDRSGRSAYPLAELAASRSFGHISPYLRIGNITNTGYEEIEGVRMPGRSYVAGLRFRLDY